MSVALLTQGSGTPSIASALDLITGEGTFARFVRERNIESRTQRTQFFRRPGGAGGSMGNYHQFRAWGDTQLASMFGTSAAAIGTSPAINVGRAMGTEPETLNVNRAIRAATDLDKSMNPDADNCVVRCRATTGMMNLLGGGPSMEQCLSSCRGESPAVGCLVTLPGGFCLISNNVLYVLLGLGLILLGAYAFTRS